jgi:tetratricopeptide (TPR) repeat protein
MGVTYIGLKRHNEAIKCCKAALHYDPNCSTAYLGIGIAHLSLQRWQKAILAFKHASKIDPGSKQVHSILFKIYMELGDTEAAAKEFEILKTLDLKDKK